AVVQRPVVSTALLDELRECARHNLHCLDLALKLQLLFKRYSAHVTAARRIAAAQGEQRPNLRQVEAALLSLLDEPDAPQGVAFIETIPARALCGRCYELLSLVIPQGIRAYLSETSDLADRKRHARWPDQGRRRAIPAHPRHGRCNNRPAYRRSRQKVPSGCRGTWRAWQH